MKLISSTLYKNKQLRLLWSSNATLITPSNWDHFSMNIKKPPHLFYWISIVYFCFPLVQLTELTFISLELILSTDWCCRVHSQRTRSRKMAIGRFRIFSVCPKALFSCEPTFQLDILQWTTLFIKVKKMKHTWSAQVSSLIFFVRSRR